MVEDLFSLTKNMLQKFSKDDRHIGYYNGTPLTSLSMMAFKQPAQLLEEAVGLLRDFHQS